MVQYLPINRNVCAYNPPAVCHLRAVVSLARQLRRGEKDVKNDGEAPEQLSHSPVTVAPGADSFGFKGAQRLQHILT